MIYFINDFLSLLIIVITVPFITLTFANFLPKSQWRSDALRLRARNNLAPLSTKITEFKVKDRCERNKSSTFTAFIFLH